MVDFDAGDDTASSDKISESLTVVGVLAGSFIKEDDAVDVVFEVGSGEKDIAVVAASVVSVGDVELFEFFVDAATGFVGSEDTLW